MSKLVPQPGIMDIAPYVPGLSKAPGSGPIAKLSSNETPLGTSDLAIEAYRASAPDLHRYPDGSAEKMRLAIGQRFNLDPNRIVCGNGSDDLIYLLAGAFSGGGSEVLFPRYSFAMYEIAAQSVGATPIAAADEELGSNVDNLLEGVTAQTKVCFLANPNNPTGTYLPAAELARLRRELPENVLLVIDAAYSEYMQQPDYSDGIDLVDSYSNTVVTHTFSKIYGLAALRLGWLYGPPQVVDILNRVRCPFNVSEAAQAAGVAALQDTAFVEAAIKHNEMWRPWLERKLGDIGLTIHPSAANFILISFGEGAVGKAKQAYNYLMENGVIGRCLDGYGLSEHLRFSIGLEAENEKLFTLLGNFQNS